MRSSVGVSRVSSRSEASGRVPSGSCVQVPDVQMQASRRVNGRVLVTGTEERSQGWLGMYRCIVQSRLDSGDGHSGTREAVWPGHAEWSQQEGSLAGRGVRQLCRSWVVSHRVDEGASRRREMTALWVGRPWPTFAAVSMRRWRFAAWDRWGAHAVASKLVWSIHCAHRTAPRWTRLAERGARAPGQGALEQPRHPTLPPRPLPTRARSVGDAGVVVM